ncbi:MAG: TIGR01244 family sulfur transferase [Pseudomonadota bacterium]
MPYRQLIETLYIGPQVTESDIAQAAEDGIRTIINVRPDGEKADAMTATEARAIAEARGLAYHHLPVSPTSITDEDVADFMQLLDGAEGPVLSHCGSGLRATVLWALGNVRELGVEAVVSKAADAGVDLGKLLPRLQQTTA